MEQIFFYGAHITFGTSGSLLGLSPQKQDMM